MKGVRNTGVRKPEFEMTLTGLGGSPIAPKAIAG